MTYMCYVLPVAVDETDAAAMELAERAAAVAAAAGTKQRSGSQAKVEREFMELVETRVKNGFVARRSLAWLRPLELTSVWHHVCMVCVCVVCVYYCVCVLLCGCVCVWLCVAVWLSMQPGIGSQQRTPPPSCCVPAIASTRRHCVIS